MKPKNKIDIITLITVITLTVVNCIIAKYVTIYYVQKEFDIVFTLCVLAIVLGYIASDIIRFFSSRIMEKSLVKKS